MAEAAGLVLGALPLLISALEHHDEVVNPLRAFKNCRTELYDLVTKLHQLHISFEQSLHILLGPITTESELAEMKNDTQSQLWQAPTIDEELRRLLGRAYVPYVQTVKDAQQLINNIVSKLDNISGAELSSQDGLSTAFDPFSDAKAGKKVQTIKLSKRIKFVMEKKEMVQTLHKLANCIASLDNFKEKADKIFNLATNEKQEMTRPVALEREFSVPNENQHRALGTVHQNLMAAWCSDHTSHSVALSLSQLRQDCGKSSIPKYMFDQDRRSYDALQERYDCIDVAVLDCAASGKAEWIRLEVHVPKRAAILDVSVTGHNALTQSANLPITSPICSITRAEHYQGHGMLVDSGGRLSGPFHLRQVPSGMSLQYILKMRKAPFTRQERYELSITLVVSLLHMSTTGWVGGKFSESEILFFRTMRGDVPPADAADIVHPYLRSDQNPLTSARGTSEATDSKRIAALGVMLLEICDGRAVDTSQHLGPNDTVTFVSSYLAAKSRLAAVQLSQGFAEAIEHCLGYFLKPGADVGDDAVVKDIEERVLKPLIRDKKAKLVGSI